MHVSCQPRDARFACAGLGVALTCRAAGDGNRQSLPGNTCHRGRRGGTFPIGRQLDLNQNPALFGGLDAMRLARGDERER